MVNIISDPEELDDTDIKMAAMTNDIAPLQMTSFIAPDGSVSTNVNPPNTVSVPLPVSQPSIGRHLPPQPPQRKQAEEVHALEPNGASAPEVAVLLSEATAGGEQHSDMLEITIQAQPQCEPATCTAYRFLANAKTSPYTCFTILVTLLCNPFIGLAAFYKSMKCRQALKQGKESVARARSNEALLLGTLGLVVGISLWALLITYLWVQSIWEEEESN